MNCWVVPELWENWKQIANSDVWEKELNGITKGEFDIVGGITELL
jgi:hypothetical protein